MSLRFQDGFNFALGQMAVGAMWCAFLLVVFGLCLLIAWIYGKKK